MGHLGSLACEAKEKSMGMIKRLCYECVRQGKILEEGCEHGEAKRTL